MSLPSAITKVHEEKFREINERESPVVDIEIIKGIQPHIRERVFWIINSLKPQVAKRAEIYEKRPHEMTFALKLRLLQGVITEELLNDEPTISSDHRYQAASATEAVDKLGLS